LSGPLRAASADFSTLSRNSQRSRGGIRGFEKSRKFHRPDWTRKRHSPHVVADSDWPLAYLEAHHGTPTVYCVSRRNGGVAVESRSGMPRCYLQAESPQLVAR